MCNEDDLKNEWVKNRIIKRIHDKRAKKTPSALLKKQTGLFTSSQSIIRQSHSLADSYGFRNLPVNVIKPRQCDNDNSTLCIL